MGADLIYDPAGSSAVLSEDGRYRFMLKRTLTFEKPRGLRTLGIIMVNPSTADWQKNDPTIMRILGFAQLWGFGHVNVANKFAYRATDIDALAHLPLADAIGPDNDRYIKLACETSDTVVVAWGPLVKLPPRMRERWKDVVRLVDSAGKVPCCIGQTAKDGHPRHPLMLPYSAPLVPWTVPWFPNRGTT